MNLVSSPGLSLQRRDNPPHGQRLCATPLMYHLMTGTTLCSIFVSYQRPNLLSRLKEDNQTKQLLLHDLFGETTCITAALLRVVTAPFPWTIRLSMIRLYSPS